MADTGMKLAVVYLDPGSGGGTLNVCAGGHEAVVSTEDAARVVRRGEVVDASPHPSPRDAYVEAERRWPEAAWTMATDDVHPRALVWAPVG